MLSTRNGGDETLANNGSGWEYGTGNVAARLSQSKVLFDSSGSGKTGQIGRVLGDRNKQVANGLESTAWSMCDVSIKEEEIINTASQLQLTASPDDLIERRACKVMSVRITGDQSINSYHLTAAAQFEISKATAFVRP